MAGLAFFDECTERVEEENGTNYIFLFLSHFSIPIYMLMFSFIDVIYDGKKNELVYIFRTFSISL